MFPYKPMLAVNWRKGGKLLKRQDSAIFCNLFYDDCFNDECDCCDLPLIHYGEKHARNAFG